MGLSMILIQRLSNFQFLSFEENNITKAENLAEMDKISGYFICNSKSNSSD